MKAEESGNEYFLLYYLALYLFIVLKIIKCFPGLT